MGIKRLEITALMKVLLLDYQKVPPFCFPAYPLEPLTGIRVNLRDRLFQQEAIPAYRQATRHFIFSLSWPAH